MANDLTIKQEGAATAQGEHTRPGRTYVPNVDIRETDDALWLWADVPGVDEDSIEVRLEEGDLHIHGRVSLDEYKALSPLYTEYNVGNFARSFRVGEGIDSEHISARLANGVLQLELPKVQRARPRQVPVMAG